MNEYITLRAVKFLGAIVLMILAGCSLDRSLQSAVDAYRAMRPASGQAVLDPGMKYLRILRNEREAFMYLGHIDQTPAGAIEVWYSNDSYVLRLLNGRSVGMTTNTGVSLLAVSFSHLPGWDEIGKQAVFDRVRDVSSGYQYNIREKVLIRPVAPLKDSQLKLVPVSSLKWFEETVQGTSEGDPAYYAVGQDGIVVYAQQCLSSEFCFSWQRWPSSAEGTK